MESAVRIISVMLLFLVFSGLKADPYAEWAGWGDAWMKEEGKKGIKLAPPNMPQLELRHVGIPPYPGSKLTILGPNGGHKDTDCSLSLGTNDDISKIITFYKATLGSDSFELFRITDSFMVFVNKKDPDIRVVIVDRDDDEDQFGFTASIVIQFTALQGYKCINWDK